MYSLSRFSIKCHVFKSSIRSAADEGDHASSSGLHGRILSTFLNELDGIVSSGGGSGDLGSQQVLVIAACQDIQQLDEALVRPGWVNNASFDIAD